MKPSSSSTPTPNSDTPRLNLVDVFAGVGGLTLGFLDGSVEPSAVFDARVLIDLDREARDVFRRNQPGVAYVAADMHKLSGPDIRKHAGLAPDSTVHVLVGGPPCQGFSWLGKRALEDERNVHVVDFLRVVRELKPLVALMENVPLIFTSHDGAIVREVCDGLSVLGYSSCADVLLSSDHGVPQLRKRAFVLAYRSDLGMPPRFPTRTHERIPSANSLFIGNGKSRFENDRLPYISVEEAIGDLPVLGAGKGDEFMFYGAPPSSQYARWAREGSVAIFNHRSRMHSPGFLEKIGIIEEGGRNEDLPDEQKFSDNYYSQAYARLHRNGIAQTVTTYFGNPGSGRFTHYRDLRSITVREAARFQSFRDVFVFQGPHAVQMRHVGNAVPPLLARAIRDQIVQDLMTIGVHKPRPRGRPPKPRIAETPEYRSGVMRAVHSKNTSAEILLRRALGEAGFRGYRLHDDRVPGNPDVVFRVPRLAVFVDGCFWHGCPKCYREPQSNVIYWKMKVQRNRDRDARVTAECKAAGWKVVRVWEHDIRNRARTIVARISRALAVKSGTKNARRTKKTLDRAFRTTPVPRI